MISQMKDTMKLLYKTHVLRSESARLEIFRDFRSIYENIYEEKVEIIKKYFLNKPFSKKSLDKIFFQSVDLVQKILSRKTAGLLEDGLKIEIYQGENLVEFDLESILSDLSFYNKMYEALNRAEFFNVCISHPVWRDERLDLDLITGDSAIVTTKKNIQLIDQISLQNIDANDEVYYSVWNEEEHYLNYLDTGKEAVEGNEDMIMVYDRLPFSVLRKKEGIDFWGEPNWNIFLNQLMSDMKLSDRDRAEFYQTWNILHSKGNKIPDGFAIEPGTIIEQNDESESSDLTYISPNVAWSDIRENYNDRQSLVLMSENIPASSASLDVKALSGSAKTIDEIELKEYREKLKIKTEKFILETLENIRMVYNYHATDKIPDGEFYIEFLQNDSYESEQDRKIRLETDKQFMIKDEVDIISDELQITQEEALEHIRERRERQISLGLSKPTLLEQTFNNLQRGGDDNQGL